MMRSIRSFLLVYLLLGITLIIAVATVGYFHVERKYLQSDFDVQLALTGHMIDAFINGESVSERSANRIKSKLNYIAGHLPYSPAHSQQTDPTRESYLKFLSHHIHFQIWDKQDHPLLEQAYLPDLKCVKDGFSYVNQAGENWRIFTLKNPQHAHCISVVQKDNLRQYLEQEIRKETTWVMIMTYLLLGFFIWVIIRKSFHSLNRIVDAIKRRESTYLAPVDITHCPKEIQPLVHELNRLFENLQETLSREKQFASDAAHELRTPLAAISMCAQLALNAADPMAQKKALKNVLVGVERGTQIIHQLLALSCMSPDMSNLGNFAPINLITQTKAIIELLTPQAEEKSITLTLITTEKEQDLPAIQGLSTPLDILMTNLIDNAIRYSPIGSPIHIVLERTHKQIQLSVIDSGPGIPPELRERVFDRFFRIPGNKTPGSGLGLNIVKQIADLHHASITLSTPESAPGLKVTVGFEIR